MYKVLYNKKLNNDSYEMAVECPNLVKNAYPGQFAIIMSKADSERIPLTIYDYDKAKGILYLIYQVVGASTYELSKIEEQVYSVSGPFGNINEICKNPVDYENKRVLYVAGGVGIAPVYPQVKYLNNLGFKVDVIYGARTKDLLLIKDKIEKCARKVYYVTDNGSYGEKGTVVDALKKRINNYDVVVTIGPVKMMKYVCDLTREYNKKTIVSMNPIMVDGSGMCGACRCEVDGKMKFACIDGPEFDGHKVNFDSAIKRMNIYKSEEEKSLKKIKGEI